MVPIPSYQGGKFRPKLSWQRLFTLLAAALCLATPADGQIPPWPTTINGYPPCLPPPPEKGPRPPTGKDSVPAFVDNVNQNDAAFEVLLGQGRILTTKENLAARGKEGAL